MNHDKLEAEILSEIEWRIKELTILKTLPIKRTLNLKEKDVIKKFAIPNVYSTWEGYVKTVFRLYINELNTLSLKHNEINKKIFTHSMDTKYPQFTTGIKNEFHAKCDFIDKFLFDLSNPITIDTGLPTESNINWKVINKLLERFNLELFPEKPYKNMLNDLLLVRNAVAHGDCSIPITQELIDKNVENITKIMDEVMFKILNGCKSVSYKTA
ncbi:hypothetical protein AGMMS49525_11480 [Bacteroidia bacterium]|nr:hypothetical protein AGMMS49525_11480 [Bacteroidia bacterium]